jgi:hypothetical protein
MDEILGILLSWQVLAIGLVVAAVMFGSVRLGAWLWRWPWARRAIVVCTVAKPWLPAVFGGALGFVPLPPPGGLTQLHDGPRTAAMVALGVVAGLCYERIWKGVRQLIEARGIDLGDDRPPSQQGKP